MNASVRRQRIPSQAYQALRNALPVVFWYKTRTLRPYLAAAFRDSPEVLAGLNFQEPTKREIVNIVVDRLLADEKAHEHATIQLMLEIASMTHFPDLEDLEDSSKRIDTAQRAVADLRRHTTGLVKILGSAAANAAQRAVEDKQAETRRRFTGTLEQMRQHFLRMHDTANPHSRGKEFEGFLTQLFTLFDLEPRVDYKLDHEQIDGAFMFDTDVYIVEARWRAEKVPRDSADAFAKKVERKGRNALGLLVSVPGFCKGVVEEYSRSTPFLTMDGVDLMYVLEGRIGLDELLMRKKRHANETGACYLPVGKMFDR